MKPGRVRISADCGSRILFGFGGSDGICESNHSYFIIGDKGVVEFSGAAFIASGSSIRCENGILKFGDNFWCNKNCFFSCSHGISFGKDVLLGWNVNVRDDDGHNIIYKSSGKNNCNCCIGDHVWIASHVDILKGVSISNGSVVAYRSCVTKTLNCNAGLIAGYSAKVIHENIEWRR